MKHALPTAQLVFTLLCLAAQNTALAADSPQQPIATFDASALRDFIEHSPGYLKLARQQESRLDECLAARSDPSKATGKSQTELENTYQVIYNNVLNVKELFIRSNISAACTDLVHAKALPLLISKQAIFYNSHIPTVDMTDAVRSYLRPDADTLYRKTPKSLYPQPAIKVHS